MIELYVRGKIAKERIMDGLRREEGLGTVEIAVIIIVLIGLALLFRTKIEAVLNTVFNNINSGLPSVKNR